jgi:predicted metal-dependent peptidase
MKTEVPKCVLEVCDLTPKQQEQWDNVMSMMMWTAPGFRHIWSRMLAQTHNNGGSKQLAVMSKDVDIAATDSRNLILNPDKFFDDKLFNLHQRVFIGAHEVVHNVYGDVELLHRCATAGKVPQHDGTSLPFEEDVMQKAMDLRINALLIASKIGRAPTIGHFDKTMTGQEGILDVYAKEYKKKKKDNPDQEGEGGNPGGFDNVMKPGASTGQNPQAAASQRNQQQWAVEIAAAQTIEQDRMQGKMASALKRMFTEILEPEVYWLDHIQTIINRVTGSGGWNWKQPDEWFIGRDIYQPHKTGKGAGWLVIWGDTSGSRGDAEISSNLAELAGIIEDVNPARLTVLWCDAEIGYVDEVTDPADLAAIKSRGVSGGGGTSQAPVFAWIKDQMETPDLFIGFTDGYVDFPKEPPYPVIWASSTDHVYPYGQVVRVNKKHAQP